MRQSLCEEGAQGPIQVCRQGSGCLAWRGAEYAFCRYIQLVLVAGHLVQYRIAARRMLFHRRDKTINLLDAYVCSGYLAARYLPEGQYNADAPPVARRYQDGLETEDCDEDTLFMIWYHNLKVGDDGTRMSASAAHTDHTRPSANNWPSEGHKEHAQTPLPSIEVPALNAKRKIAVFRARSKLDRDAWVWAINSEIEKVLRVAKDREDAIREAGDLAELKE